MSEFIETASGILVPSSSFGRAADSPYRSANPLNRAVQEWFPSSGEADETLLPSLGTLRSQSRDLDRNEGIARGATETIVGAVAGEGLRPQSKLDHELLGIRADEARHFERMAERLYELHADSIHSDYRQAIPFQMLQAVALRAVLLDGDCLIVRRYRKTPGAILGTAYQLIEGSRLESPYQGTGDDIREGVELDRDGRAVAYHVRNNSPMAPASEEQKIVRIPRFDEGGELQVLHLFQTRLPGQTRGEPFLSPVIEKFKQLGRYTDAEIMAAVISAFFSVFVTSENGGPFAGRSDAHLATRKNEPQTRSSEKLGHGLLVNLLPGEKIESLAPGRPNSGFDPFVQAVLRQIGMGLGIPYEVLIQHFQSSYSASRAALLEAWRAFKLRRSWLVTMLCQPVYVWFIEDAVRSSLLTAPGFGSPFLRQLYLSTEWIGSVMESIDPLKDAKADEVNIRIGTASRRSIVEEQGKDFEKLKRQIEAESGYSGLS